MKTDRNAFPFHNPRQNVPCCNRRKQPEPPCNVCTLARLVLACIILTGAILFTLRHVA